jgi:hypothetical protein
MSDQDVGLQLLKRCACVRGGMGGACVFGVCTGMQLSLSSRPHPILSPSVLTKLLLDPPSTPLSYIFIHLDKPSDKLALLLQMLHKLYALVNQQCCEDNPDALTHHELLLPGHLLAKVRGGVQKWNSAL